MGDGVVKVSDGKRRVAVAMRVSGGAWYCQGCGEELVGGVAHTCAGLQRLMSEEFKLSTDTWTPPPGAHPLVVREDHDPGDEHVERAA